MSKPSDNYLMKIEKWLLNGTTLRGNNMTPDQKLRARLCYEAYQIWLQDKQIAPTQLLRNIANRDYPILLRMAKEGDSEAQEMVQRCNILPGKARTVSEIANDVAVLNWLIGRFSCDTTAIEKAKVIDASDWLIRSGMKMMDAKAVKSGADLKMQLNNNFDEKMNAAEQLPDTEINITGDVSIINSTRANYTDEEKAQFSKRVGMTQKQVEAELAKEDNDWMQYVEDAEAEEVYDPLAN